MINISNRRECFFDSYLIDENKTTAGTRIHHPIKREPVMIYDAPWEGNNSHYQTMLFDGEKYMMYYYAGSKKKSGGFCVAVSKDCMTWERPNCGIVEFEGSKNNNLVTGKDVFEDQSYFDNFTVFYDNNPSCPADERYKATAMGMGKLRCFCSGDGMHFRFHSVITDKGEFDSINLAFWDNERKKYFCYYRGEHEPSPDADITIKSYTDKQAAMLFDPVRGAYRDSGDGTVAFTRDIRVIESTDFCNWSEPKMLTSNGPDMQYYTNGVLPYPRAPHIFVAFPTRYVERKSWTPNYDELCGKEERIDKMKTSAREGLALTDCLFMTSRDGYNFTRYDEAFLSPAPECPTNWYYGNCYPATFLLETSSNIPGADNEYSIFCNESDYAIADDHATAFCRFTIRLDGFVSRYAGGDEKLLVTKEFTYDGSILHANIATSARGYAYFTLKCGDEEYTSYEVFGNSVNKRIHFVDADAVEKLCGKPVTLEIRMYDCDIYSIKFDT